LFVIVGGAVAITASVTTASRAQVLREDRTASATQPANEQVRSTEGAIARASSLMDQQVSDGKFTGRIQQLLLDLDGGRVALVVVATDATAGDESKRMVLPAELFGNLVNGEIKLSPEQLQATTQLPEQPQDLTRAWAEGIYTRFGLTPYWKHSDAKFRNEDVFVSTERLHDTPVVDRAGKKIAQVQDLAITSRGAIAYAGLAKLGDAERLYPVPLSAFVVLSDDATWRLDLPSDIVENTPTFAADKWPKSLDRGWLEYVHVRYGRSVFDGVNRSARPTQGRAAQDGQAR